MTELVNIENGDILTYEPMNPLELEALIRNIGDRLENAIPAIRDMWRDRYAAERAFIEGHAKAMLMSKQDTVSMARKEADLATMELKRTFDDAKEILHAAEALQKALQAKLYGYLNLNKALTATFQVGGVGR